MNGKKRYAKLSAKKTGKKFSITRGIKNFAKKCFMWLFGSYKNTSSYSNTTVKKVASPKRKATNKKKTISKKIVLLKKKKTKASSYRKVA